MLRPHVFLANDYSPEPTRVEMSGPEEASSTPGIIVPKSATSPLNAISFGSPTNPIQRNSTHDHEAASSRRRKDLTEIVVCRGCKEFHPNLIEDNSDLICEQCGLALEGSLVSVQPGLRTYSSDPVDDDYLTPSRVSGILKASQREHFEPPARSFVCSDYKAESAVHNNDLQSG